MFAAFFRPIFTGTWGRAIRIPPSSRYSNADSTVTRPPATSRRHSLAFFTAPFAALSLHKLSSAIPIDSFTRLGLGRPWMPNNLGGTFRTWRHDDVHAG